MRLSVENGTFYFRKNVPIFEDINFTVDSGEILAILGPNGAGKTTMLRCITGMLRWRGGRSLLDGEDIAKIPPKHLWTKMAYVPQAKNVTSAYTVLEMALLGRSSKLNVFETPKQEDIDCVRKVLEDLEISHLAEQKCSEISGGELQMVLMARALASEPKVLVLDEPESNLDFKNQLLVLDTMSRLAKQGMTCIFNTHYPAHALQRADKSLMLSKENDYIFGDTKVIVTEKNILRFFDVEAKICDIETQKEIIQDVIPIRVTESNKKIREV